MKQSEIMRNRRKNVIPVVNLDGEVWRKMEGFPEYEVSNKGRVKSLNYWKWGIEAIKRPKEDQKGYLRMSINGDGGTKTIKVHRAVAEAFLDNPERKPEVNHKDGNKKNNCVENLEWVTTRENQIHSWNIGIREKSREALREIGRTVGKQNCAAAVEARRTPVIATNIESGETLHFKSQTEAADKLKLHQANIYKVLNGERKRCGEYSFRYAEEGD